MKTYPNSLLSASLKLSTIAAFAVLASLTMNSLASAQTTSMPDEAAPHEGTWLQWPHHYTYGKTYRSQLDATWVTMTQALVGGEKVHIIAYNAAERTRITSLLSTAKVPLTNVDFILAPTDDVWVRDNGPVFVRNSASQLIITDWGFNGWGFDTRFTRCDAIPAAVAAARGLSRFDFNDIILEGGAVVLDGQGTLIATRSSILEPDRNPGLTQAELETELRDSLGVKKFIWLAGAPGGQDDITDMHIDGFVSFAPGRKLVTMSDANLRYWGVPAADITAINAATDASGVRYTKVLLPLTARDVVTTYGARVGFKGSYINYYVANKVVLMPTYNDPNDAAAKTILQAQYPGRTVVGIDCRNLYINGGMVHCVTQQQPR